MGCEWDAYMGRSTPVGIRERGCMYFEWGGVCEETNAGWVAENKVVCTVSGMRMWGDRRRFAVESRDVFVTFCNEAALEFTDGASDASADDGAEPTDTGVGTLVCTPVAVGTNSVDNFLATAADSMDSVVTELRLSLVVLVVNGMELILKTAPPCRALHAATWAQALLLVLSDFCTPASSSCGSPTAVVSAGARGSPGWICAMMPSATSLSNTLFMKHCLSSSNSNPYDVLARGL